MSLYKDRIAKGLCGSCGKEPLQTKSLGVICLGKFAGRAADKRAKQRAEHKCYDCNKIIPEDETRCPDCKKKQAKGQADRVEARGKAGLCKGCGKRPPKGEDYSLCQECIDDRTKVTLKHYERRRKAGLCHYCNNQPLPDEIYCAHHKQLYTDYRFKTKMEVMDAYGGPVCAECGCSDADVLEVDHVNGGGRKHFRDLGISGGYQFYLWLRREGFPAGYRILCPTCNKKVFRGSPHAKRPKKTPS